MELDKKYKKLKEKIVDNFDYWLDNYIAIDISEAGKVDYIINEIDEYYFCLELEQELKFIIDELIYSSNKELLIKYVNLKRILNNKIINNKYYKQEDLNNIYDIENKDDVAQYYIRLKSNIKNINKIKKALYNYLINERYIECPLKEFQELFVPSNKNKQIIWLGRQIDLLGLIYLLEKKNIVSLNNFTKAKFALTYFKSTKGQYKLRSLEVKSSEIITEEYKYQGITEFINKIIE